MYRKSFSHQSYTRRLSKKFSTLGNSILDFRRRYNNSIHAAALGWLSGDFENHVYYHDIYNSYITIFYETNYKSCNFFIFACWWEVGISGEGLTGPYLFASTTHVKLILSTKWLRICTLIKNTYQQNQESVAFILSVSKM